MSDVVLVFNAGSSSLKFTVFQVGQNPAIQKLIKGRLEYDVDTFHFFASDQNDQLLDRATYPLSQKKPLEYLLDWLADHEQGQHNIVGVGHRIVHGGPDFLAPVQVTPEILRQLEALTPFAPLHQPQTLAPVHAIMLTGQTCSRLPVLIRLSTALCLKSRGFYRSHAGMAKKVSAGMASMVFPTIF